MEIKIFKFPFLFGSKIYIDLKKSLIKSIGAQRTFEPKIILGPIQSVQENFSSQKDLGKKEWKDK